MPALIPEVLLDVEDVAQMLGVHRVTLARWRQLKRPGELHVHLKVGSRVRYRLADVERFLAEARRGSESCGDERRAG